MSGRRAPCQGAIKRYGNDYPCGAGAAYAVRNEDDKNDARGACRHHLAQVIDSMEAASVLVVPIKDEDRS